MFWKEKKMEDMSHQEWESLCDGCGKCCLLKLEDPDTLEIAYTACSCNLLDTEKIQCKQYASRAIVVPECVQITPANIDSLTYLPSTCAYRLVAQGKDLPEWHYLVSGDKDLIHKLGKSVLDYCVPVENVPEEDWVDLIVEIED
jgi:uncharacterized cysteine cluster protein YcgN (CxxCxxCC family)